MSAYNNLHADVTCPHCGLVSEVDAQVRFGFLQLTDYRVGDRIQWHEGPTARIPQARPDGGHWLGEGWVLCTRCDADYSVRVLIEGDRISGVEPLTPMARAELSQKAWALVVESLALAAAIDRAQLEVGMVAEEDRAKLTSKAKTLDQVRQHLLRLLPSQPAKQREPK